MSGHREIASAILRFLGIVELVLGHKLEDRLGTAENLAALVVTGQVTVEDIDRLGDLIQAGWEKITFGAVR